MKKSITSLLKGWCAALLCAGLTLPSFAAADADAAFAVRHRQFGRDHRATI